MMMRLYPTGSGWISGRVVLREPLGVEDEVLVEVADGTRVKVVTPSGEDSTEGVVVGVDVMPSDLYLFQPEGKTTLCYGID
jgi:hypothetical protein